jgi:hypothetical protein
MKMKRRKFFEIALAGMITVPSSMYGQEKSGIIRRTNMANLKGFAIRDPSNKQKIKGFIQIPAVWGEQLKNTEDVIPQPGTLGRAIIGLVESVNKYTDINASLDKHLYLSSKILFEYPMIYIATYKAFELTETEINNLDNYLRNGGFIVMESLEPELNNNQGEASLKKMMRDTLKEDSRFLPIPNSHSLYHCYFDFSDGPPQGTENKISHTSTTGDAGATARELIMPNPLPYLEGIFLDDRLVAVYSGKGYGKKWKSMSNNEPQQKMGVNMVVFALTQAGGIARQRMDAFYTARQADSLLNGN